MGYEVEVKYRVTDFATLSGRLLACGAVAGEPIDQADAYLAHPARDFAQTHEAFRIRLEGDKNCLTYKGPKHEGPTKTREEIEIAFASGPQAFDQMERLCQALGFRHVAVVRKSRRPYHFTVEGLEIAVVLDEVIGLGSFAEVEALASSSADLPAAQAAVLKLAKTLGLTEVEPHSYLRMLLNL